LRRGAVRRQKTPRILPLAAQIIQGPPAAGIPLALVFHQVLQKHSAVRADFVMRNGIS
jgi:hypothetical protein